MINVAADKYLYQLEEIVSREVNLQLYDPGEEFPDVPDGTHALLIRTVTPISSNTIGKLPKSLSFIGTGSAGTDHVDTALLNERNIVFSNAAGCNARSVAEYVCTSLLIWSDQRKVELTKKTVGIVGVGNVGSQLKDMLGKLDISTICYDPPREQRDPNFSSATIAEVLSSDILTLHTPLTEQGKYPSYHWLDEEKLSNHHFDLVINTARGGVVDESSLLKAKSCNRVDDFIIDVWENEPLFSDEVAKNAFIYTPHIAGYSIQAKQRASSMIIEEMCKYFGISQDADNLALKHPQEDYSQEDFESLSLSQTLHKIHPLADYQQKLSALIGALPAEKKARFNTLRSTHPLRSEYSSLTMPSLSSNKKYFQNYFKK